MQVASLQVSAARRLVILLVGATSLLKWLGEFQGHIYQWYNTHTFLLNQGNRACLHTVYLTLCSSDLYFTGGIREEVSLLA